MFQGGLRKQLFVVTGIGILVTAVLALVAMRTFVVEAFTRQMRDGLTPKPFLQARESRHQALAHTLKFITFDNEFNIALRSASGNASFKEFVDLIESGSADLKKPESKKKLAELYKKYLEIGFLDNSDRLFLNVDTLSTDSSSEKAEAVPVGSLADLLLVCSHEGTVVLERRTGDDSSSPDSCNKITKFFPLSRAENYQLPSQLSMEKSPLLLAALEQQTQRGDEIPQRGYFRYGDGYIYDGVALPIHKERGCVVILADRIDHQMALQASRLVGDCAVVAISNGSPTAAVWPIVGSSSVAKPSADLQDVRVKELADSFSSKSASTDNLTARQTVSLGGQEYLTRVSFLPAAVEPVVLDGLVDPAEKGIKAGEEPVGQLVFLKRTAELEALVTKQYLATLVAVLLAVGISFVIVGQLVGRLAKPLLDLASSMSKVGKGDLEVTAPIAGPTEIQDAAKAFNQMIDSLRQKDTLQALVNRLEEIRKSADVTDPLVRDQAQFGKYVVARKLGGGGMATVYVGLPIETLKEDDRVALKVIHREFAGNEEYQTRFRREYDVMQSLRHPSLVQVIDAGSLNGLLYIVMEYVEGKNLADHLEGKPGMPVRDFLGLVIPLLEAMQYSHNKGIVHRDLKPENLMLTPVGIKVMDFGLAMGSDMSRITQSGSAIGTPRYMSPEQINGQDCDGRCDQYALGIIFYEMLAARCPFDGNDVLAIVFQHLSQTPQPLSVHRKDLPVEIVDAVAKMLAKEPEHRFKNLVEIRDIFSKLIT